MSQEHVTYPKSIFFLIGTEFCERFNYYALRGTLTIYLTEMLMYDDRKAKIIYHLFSAAIYILPLIGEIISDSGLGKYKTILYLSFICVAGNIVLGVSAIKELELSQNKERQLAMIALGLIALGSSGIKSCVVPFGVDQFELPKQEHEMDAYFHMFEFIINIATFVSLLVTPLLRKQVSCFGEDTCYPVAFILPAVLMFFAIGILKLGRKLYRKTPPEDVTLAKIIACTWTAVWTKLTAHGVHEDHWLDYSIEKYGEELVSETRTFLKLFLVFLPLSVFWALFEQQATAWTFQARELNGELGTYFTILPDQMQVVNPALLFIFVPIFERAIRPCFNHIRLLRTPLQLMTLGCLLASFAFVLTASVQFRIEQSALHPLHKFSGFLRVVNVFNCDIEMRSYYYKDYNAYVKIKQMSSYGASSVRLGRHINIVIKSQCNHSVDVKTDGEAPAYQRYATCYSNLRNKPLWCSLEDISKSSLKGNCRVRVIFNQNELFTKPVIITFYDSGGNIYLQYYANDVSYRYMTPGVYGIEFCCTRRYYVTFSVGGTYAVAVFAKKKHDFLVSAIEITPPNKLHMLSLLPQYAVMTAAEVLLAVTGLEFALLEAPNDMKAVVESFWLLSIGMGQLIVVAVEYFRIVEEDSTRYSMYAGLMLGDTLIFILIAGCCYTYVNFGIDKEEEEEEDDD